MSTPRSHSISVSRTQQYAEQSRVWKQFPRSDIHLHFSVVEWRTTEKLLAHFLSRFDIYEMYQGHTQRQGVSAGSIGT